MREALLKRLAIAVLLLAAGVFTPIANASAHQGHGSSPTVHSPTVQKIAAPDLTFGADSAEIVARGAFAVSDPHSGQTPCSEHDGSAHMGGCCTVACHAALGASAVAVGAYREQISLIDAWPAEVLAGLSGHGTERPPKLA